MSYISGEEFLNQPQKVQNAFITWWKPQVGDLVHDKINIVGVIVPVLCIGDYKSNLDKNKVIPLFQMHQLIEFIEDNSCKNSKLEIEWCNDGYIINIVSEVNDEKVFNEYITFEKEILKALWKVSIKIIGENK
ncbi:hypothetical protein AB2T19_002831 [Clostridium botulinum]